MLHTEQLTTSGKLDTYIYNPSIIIKFIDYLSDTGELFLALSTIPFKKKAGRNLTDSTAANF